MSTKEVSVANFDVLRLGLRKELDRLKTKIGNDSNSNRGISLSMDINGMNDLMRLLVKMMEFLSSVDFKPEVEINPTFTVPDITIPDIKIPEIKVPSVIVPTPNVTVNPEVNVDVKGIIGALENLKFLSDRPNKPISVRMSDGQKFVKAIQDLQKATDNLGVVYSGSSGLSTDDLRNLGMAVTNTVGDGSKTVTTAGTRVQLTSSNVPCRKVKVIALAANTGTIWVGGATVASGRGEPLVSQQSTDWIETTNVSNIYIDSTVNAEGVSYIYV